MGRSMTDTLVLRHAAELIAVGAGNELRRRGFAMRHPVVIPDGAAVIEGDTIRWVGPTSQLPPLPPNATLLDCPNQIILPGFVDSHTHLIFAGSREDEFEQRLQGRTYQDIAAAGGGILSTVNA